jgi:hypothetical protein
MVGRMDIPAKIVELLEQRAPEGSICPSEVARALASNAAGWRHLMPQVRDAAATLAHQHCVRITQGDREVDPDEIYRGPIRLRRGRAYPR